MTALARVPRPPAHHARRRDLATSTAPADRFIVWLPLAVILAAEAVLSGQLIHYSIATGDESLYIYAGHQLIHELWHGGGSPYYETWFSGAPVLYPVLAAMADYLGGLVAVRLMSLVFMLAATGLLYATTRRLFGYWPGVTAAGLFAGLGVTHALGALATFDAMSLMLIAAAAYCAVRAGEGGRWASRWLLVVPLALLAANTVKYASVIFDPVVIVLAAVQVRGQGWKRAAQRFLALTATTGVLLVLFAVLSGTAYLQGILFTTIARKAGAQQVFGLSTYIPARTLLLWSWDWTGAILALGLIALVASPLVSRERRNVAPLVSLLLASFLLLAEYLRLHSSVAFSKHTDLAAWFTCAAAGYALARAATLAARWKVKVPLAAAAAAVTVLAGIHYSNTGVTEARSLAATNLQVLLYARLKPYLELRNARVLLGGLRATQMLYVDHVDIPWYRYTDDEYIKYPIPGRGGDSHGVTPGRVCSAVQPGCMYLTGAAAYRAAIHAHWFDVISVVGTHQSPQDKAIVAAVRSAPGYRLLTTLAGAPTYIYAPAYAHAGIP